ncbi:MAG: histidine kinase [Prevotella sp.]|nr:histidine kinase [Prevotella sp.]
MSKIKIRSKENLVYLVIWAILFVTPVISFYLRNDEAPVGVHGWREVLGVWRVYLPLLIIFIIHNVLLAPLLIYRRKTPLYILFTLCIVGAFIALQCSHRPAAPPYNGEPHTTAVAQHAPPIDANMPPPPDKPRGIDDIGKRPPLIWGQHDIVNVIFLIMLLAINLGIKNFFKTEEELRNMHELEKENIRQELNMLKYQINPHFLMNTLNNIHALVDINPDGAKESIVELSKIMRYILYKDDEGYISLDREVKFLNHYIHLMRIRYADSVAITTSFPATLPNRNIPSLLLISFVENAFKHGISYRLPSFVDIAITADDDRMTFTCRNSNHSTAGENKGGIGLANVKRRLDILYPNNHTLLIDDNGETYSVRLEMPLTVS